MRIIKKVKKQRLAGGQEWFRTTGRMPVLLLIVFFAQAQVLDDFESSRGWAHRCGCGGD